MKHLLFLSLALFFTTSAFSDTKFSLGAGFNFNTIDTEGSLGSGVDEEISIDLSIAGKVEVGINDLWLFRTGLWLQEKSAKYSIDFAGIEGDITSNTSYLSVPLNLKYQASKDIGIFGGYIADVRINDYCSTGGDFNSCTIDEDSRSVVHLATLGVSILGSEKFNVDLSWQQGLTDYYKDLIKMHTFQAMAFYKF